MEIEITTTKKKLTKSIINQMQTPSIFEMNEGNVLGYMIRVKKNSFKTILIEYNSKYFVISSNWNQGVTMVSHKVKSWFEKIELSTPEKCQAWWDAYQRVLSEAKTQIYV